RVESPNAPLDGLVILDGGAAVTAIPLESVALDRIAYAQMSETPDLFTGVALVNPWAIAATINISVMRGDGITLGQASMDLPPNSKYAGALHDIVSEAAGYTSGYFVIRSSLPIYSAGTIGATNGAFIAD